MINLTNRVAVNYRFTKNQIIFELHPKIEIIINNYDFSKKNADNTHRLNSYINVINKIRLPSDDILNYFKIFENKLFLNENGILQFKELFELNWIYTFCKDLNFVKFKNTIVLEEEIKNLLEVIKTYLKSDKKIQKEKKINGKYLNDENFSIIYKSFRIFIINGKLRIDYGRMIQEFDSDEMLKLIKHNGFMDKIVSDLTIN
jgi:hypothetical protein